MGSLAKGADVGAILQSRYDEASKAFATRNEAVIDGIYSSKFVLVGLDGKKMDRKTVVADYAKQMASMENASWKRTVQKLTVSGFSASVSVKSHFKGLVVLQSKKHVFEADGTSKDTWLKSGKNWTLVKSQVLGLAATLDGRPLRRG